MYTCIYKAHNTHIHTYIHIGIHAFIFILTYICTQRRVHSRIRFVLLNIKS